MSGYLSTRCLLGCYFIKFLLCKRQEKRQGFRLPDLAGCGVLTVLHSVSMFDVILYQPEIPPNTGNIIRLCANTGMRLHLVKPLGFSMDDKQLVRAGLDYHEFAKVKVHDDWSACADHFVSRRIFAVSTKGARRYNANQYSAGDVFLFGSETRGLSSPLLESFPEDRRIRLPMLPDSRSLNLSNAVAVVVYEAWRQVGFRTGA